MSKILDYAKSLQPELEKVRCHLHQNPEAGSRCPETAEFVKAELKKIGIAPVECGDTGVIGLVGGKKPGKTFMIRADMDGLPMKEETDLEYKSKNGNMHACGHDIHTTMLLGAAKTLKHFEDEINGTIKLMFQPGEEALAGAKSMIDDGVLENPKVNAAMSFHVYVGLPFKSGTICLQDEGPCMASSDGFEITVQGKGTHGAAPHLGIDPLIALSNIHLGIQALNAREAHPGEFLIATVGQINGGTAANIIPDSAFLTGTIRSYSKELTDLAKSRIAEIAESVAKAYRCTAKVVYHSSCPFMINSPELRSNMMRYTKDLLSEDVATLEKFKRNKGFGSEDFAFISQKVPAIVGFILSETKDNYLLHHPKVEFDVSIMYRGSAVYANTAMRWLEEHK